MKNHLSKYATAYLIGFFFFCLTVGNDFLSVTASYTPEQIKSMGLFQWVVILAHLAVAVSTTMLAFINKQVADDSTKPSSTVVNTPTPVTVTATPPTT